MAKLLWAKKQVSPSRLFFLLRAKIAVFALQGLAGRRLEAFFARKERSKGEKSTISVNFFAQPGEKKERPESSNHKTSNEGEKR